MTQDNAGPKLRFGADSFDEGRLNLAKNGIARRLDDESSNFVMRADLQIFASKEGNHIQLTSPKTVLVENPELEFAEYFHRLVHVDARSRKMQNKPDLRALFEVPLFGVPLERNLSVSVKGLGRLKIPYAYKNGALHLIKPEGFPVDDSRAIAKGKQLAADGHLVANDPKADGTQRRLIVVGDFNEAISEDTRRNIQYIFREHETRLVAVGEMDSFIEEVRQEAHH
jgi:hypothetical protein